MNRRAFLSLVVVATAGGGTAWADEPVDRVLRDLRRMGYRTVSVERTLLRRTRILAENAEAQREIILNPNTGEILRDLWIPLGKASSSGSSGGLLGDDNSGSGSGSGDDNGDDDHSGSGGGDDGGGDDGGDDGGGDDGGGDDDGGDDGGQGRGRGRGGDDD